MQVMSHRLGRGEVRVVRSASWGTSYEDQAKISVQFENLALHEIILQVKTEATPTSRMKMIGHRSFSHAGPSVWNSLPRGIRHVQSTTASRTALKTHLFKPYLY